MINKLEQGFFGFFVKQYKVSLLMILLLIFYGAFTLYQIPKESSPDIKFGIIGITTIYTGVNPTDIDSLITEKIEKEVKDIEGIKKITSTSSLGVSNITLELQTGVDTKDILVDVKDKVDSISLPTDAEDPFVSELSSDNEMLFSFYMYAPIDKYSVGELFDKSVVMQKYLEGKNGITDVNISPDSDYEILVGIDKTKLENFGLTFSQISSIIKSYNKNTPIGNYEIGDMKYDFRFDGEFSNMEELFNTPIISEPGRIILLGDIAEIKRDYKSKDLVSELGFYKKAGYNYVKLTVNKKPKISIFSTSDKAKKMISDKIATSEFSGIGYTYTTDLADEIIKDYKGLAENAVSTLALVFVLLFIFLGLKEGLIATLLIPLAFFVTFITLNILGLSLNFLTNFSLLLTLGIALDTIIVIVEGASEKMKMGYNSKAAVLLAVKEFKIPLISGTATTLVVFLPMMLLPGVIGKFLAYIPITVFITLLAGLFLSLTLNSPIFMLLSKDKKYFIKSDTSEQLISEEEKELLIEHREGKVEKSSSTGGIRYKFFGAIEGTYYKILSKNISKPFFRFLIIFVPLILLIISFVTISPKLGFKMFPSGDNVYINISVSAKEGTNTEAMKKYTKTINESISNIPEVKVFSLFVKNEEITVAVELFDKDLRDLKGLRDSFKVENQISNELKVLTNYGLNVESKVEAGGPPAGSPVGIKLLAETNKSFDDLLKVAGDFEEFLKGIEGTKNVKNSSSSTPGQFVFKLNNEKISSLGLTPNDVLSEIYFMSSGIKAGTIKGDYDDHDIVIKISDFENKKLSPSDISEMYINTKVGKIKIGSISSYQFLPAISTINREAGNVTVSVESDLDEGFLPTQVQPLFLEFAQNYDYPKGISYSSGGEASENAELISSTISSFVIAIFLIFSILVLQFNSFLQPAIVLYSIVLALLGVNVGLYLTGNPYSMPFAIGFIALTGIVVNNAIILIDKINTNLEMGVDKIEAVAESGKSRLRPILLTTLTTLFGILPLALEDEFWAGLGFTIIFGLLFATVLTLFVTPSLYYQLFLRPKKEFFIKRFFKFIFKR